MAAARRRTATAPPLPGRQGRRLKRTLKARKLSRSARYAGSVRPAESAELRYRLALRRVIAKWWAKIGPQALRLAKKIAPPITADAGDDEGGSFELGDFDDEAAAPWFVRSIDNVANDVLSHSERELKRIGIKLKHSDPGVAKMVPQWRRENVDLVQTMFKRERTALEKLLENGAGRRWETLSRDIQDRLGVTERHADLLARDQTNKLNSGIARQRMINAGIEKYRWTSAGDERVRPMHDDLDGEVFSFDDPPVTNEDGDTNNPGDDYMCRCVAFPILPELDDSSDDSEEAVSDD